jgi:hypothetical protein
MGGCSGLEIGVQRQGVLDEARAQVLSEKLSQRPSRIAR